MDRTHGFVEWLRKLDRKALAELRRSLAFEPGTYARAYPYVESFVTSEYERRCFYLLAGLFALYEQAGVGQGTLEAGATERVLGLGSALATLYDKRERSPSIEQRFIALLDADEEQLPYRLRQVVTLLKSEQIPIGWTQLLNDLLAWNHERRYVQQRWARDFYRVVQPVEASVTVTE